MKFSCGAARHFNNYLLPRYKKITIILNATHSCVYNKCLRYINLPKELRLVLYGCDFINELKYNRFIGTNLMFKNFKAKLSLKSKTGLNPWF